MNVLGPKIAGRFQVSTTVIKLIPLVLMAVIGTIHGLQSGIARAELRNRS
jgi:APA family basic amino acid/polyamine antiporter